MPYQGEHAARINPPGKYARMRRQNNKFGPGIHVIFGILAEGGSEVQAIRFDSDKYSVDEAKKWLKDHDYKPIEFEPAAELEKEQEQEQDEPVKRYLSVQLAPSNDIQELNGGLLVPGVKLLAPGIWTDSTQKKPCRYTAETLQRYLSNWTDLSYWSRHGGGTPRDITDRIADIQNVRFNEGVEADLFFHGVTSKSKDAISLIKAAAEGKVPWPYSSVEMVTNDRWIVSEKLFEAYEIRFDGAAMVNMGACRVCKIRNAEEGQPDATPSQNEPLEQANDQPAEQDTIADQDDTMPDEKDTKDLEAQIEQLKKQLEDATKPKPVELPKELTDLIAKQTETIKELSGRLEKLEKGPADPKTAPPKDEGKALEAPVSNLSYDSRKGEITVLEY